ncbi:MAG: hypothetical protein ACK4FJ_09345 [Ferrovibrio sp.]|uniref:hypothetical protein n=1 Tax=Ferrovibrio sp. TaxID=1917215 RepID=UPI00391926FB
MSVASRFTLLDASDANAVLAYEASFYRAFSAVTGNRLIRWLWQWDDDAKRLATRIPYNDQIVYLQREANGEVRAALAVNVALRQCQAGAFGFAMPEDKGLCEFLTVFVNDGHDLRTRYAFWTDCFADLRNRGLLAGYATTARRPLGLYRRLGADVVATATIEGEERFFLRFSLDRDYIRRRTEAAAA